MAKNTNAKETAKQVLSTAGGEQQCPKHRNQFLDKGNGKKLSLYLEESLLGQPNHFPFSKNRRVASKAVESTLTRAV